MTNPSEFWNRARQLESVALFDELALELFNYQKVHVSVYRRFLGLLGREETSIESAEEILFLPVTVFKSHDVYNGTSLAEKIFTSSGTTGSLVSRHPVADLTIYNQSLLDGFRIAYGDPSQYCILALLPSYLERPGSSLVYMAERLIRESGHPDSGFYLYNYKDLFEKLNLLKNKGEKIFLIGVTFALLDLFDQFPISIPGAIIMETGGMKGRRKELIRAELHDRIRQITGVDKVHSEYGMTELLSQAYSTGDGFFRCPPWMHVEVHDIHDPFEKVSEGETGVIHVIDLANVNSCGFIATQDLGRKTESGTFEVLGRLDNSELRGCNLMIG